MNSGTVAATDSNPMQPSMPTGSSAIIGNPDFLSEPPLSGKSEVPFWSSCIGVKKIGNPSGYIHSFTWRLWTRPRKNRSEWRSRLYLSSPCCFIGWLWHWSSTATNWHYFAESRECKKSLKNNPPAELYCRRVVLCLNRGDKRPWRTKRRVASEMIKTKRYKLYILVFCVFHWYYIILCLFL